jgi:hypothetical protein
VVNRPLPRNPAKSVKAKLINLNMLIPSRTIKFVGVETRVISSDMKT